MPTPCNVVTNCAQETTLTTKNYNRILACFDVDNSMLKEHIHNALANRCEPYTSDNGLWVVDKGQIKLQDDRTQANPSYNPDHVKEMTKWFFNYIPICIQIR